jgi:isopropylmalate/homocitrate/citramalate synthase
MTDLPTHVDIHEEGPREGFQIEPGPINTADKIKLIEALAETGLHHIQAASFVSPRIVPGWADAEDVVAGFTPAKAFTTPHGGSTRTGSTGPSSSATS